MQAYQQALSNAKRGGAAQAAGGAAISAIRGKMQADEAKQILNFEDVSELDEKKVEEKFKRMYDLNSPMPEEVSTYSRRSTEPRRHCLRT